MKLCNCDNCSKCKNIPSNANLTARKIVLAGNPNVGKSVIFGALTGIYAEVSNYPGTTVSITSANTQLGEIIDSPGTYALGNYSDDERVTREILTSADVVINVLSALSLERDLFLTTILMDMGLKMLIVVNQADEARKNNIIIDFNELENYLGMRVIPCVATQNKGISEIVSCLEHGCFFVSQNVSEFVKKFNLSREEKIKRILEIEASNGKDKDFEKVQSQRINFINKVVKNCVEYQNEANSFLSMLEKALFNPFFGSLTVLAVLFILFQIIGVFISGNVVDFIYGSLENNFFPHLKDFISMFVPYQIIRNILCGEFGIFTMALGIIVGVLIPLLTAFYIFMSILEDSGYLPRLAVFCDNALNKIGLNGKAVIPLILGFGCTTMGAISTRILGSNKERMITTALLGITVPCAAQQGIILTLLASIGGFKVWIMYLMTLIAIMAFVGTFLNKISNEKTSGFLISLPPLRLPKLKNIAQKTLSRMICFLKEALPFFVISSVVISLLDYFGILKLIANILKPIVVNILHLPAEFTNVFIMGLIRRDLAAAGLFSVVGLEGGTQRIDDLQIFVSAIVITLFVPCVAMLIMVFKERGIKEGIILWLSAFFISIITGALLTRTCAFLFG